MRAAIRAALFADRKRPAVWAVGGSWIALAIGFGIGIPYLVYCAISDDPKQADAAESLLESVLPGSVVSTGIGLFPLFGGAIVLVLGALVAGNEYRWGTLNLIFTQRPRRSEVLAGHMVALLAVALAMVAATFLTVALATALIAVADGRGLDWPTLGSLTGAVAAGWLICAAHAGLGCFLAILFRNAATAIAIGLLWTLVLENAISALALVLTPFEVVQKALLAPSSGALAGAFGARSQFDGGTPGVLAGTNGWLPAVVLAGYVVLLFGASLRVAARRDVI